MKDDKLKYNALLIFFMFLLCLMLLFPSPVRIKGNIDFKHDGLIDVNKSETNFFNEFNIENIEGKLEFETKFYLPLFYNMYMTGGFKK